LNKADTIKKNLKIKKYIADHPRLTNSQIAEKLSINRSTVNRLRNEIYHPKASLTESAVQGHALSMEGFEGVGETTTDEKTKKEVTKVSVYTPAGPLTGNRFSLNSIMGDPFDIEKKNYDERLIETWTPHMQLSVWDGDADIPHALSAAQITVKRQENQRWLPRYYVNPMQSLDLITFEALSRSTFGGPLMQAVIKFVLGTGFRP